MGFHFETVKGPSMIRISFTRSEFFCLPMSAQRRVADIPPLTYVAVDDAVLFIPFHGSQVRAQGLRSR